MSEYYAGQCPKCTGWNSFTTKNPIEATFACRRCGASRKVKLQGSYGLNLLYRGPFPARDIGLIVARLNEAKV